MYFIKSTWIGVESVAFSLRRQLICGVGTPMDSQSKVTLWLYSERLGCGTTLNCCVTVDVMREMTGMRETYDTELWRM